MCCLLYRSLYLYRLLKAKSKVPFKSKKQNCFQKQKAKCLAYAHCVSPEQGSPKGPRRAGAPGGNNKCFSQDIHIFLSLKIYKYENILIFKLFIYTGYRHLHLWQRRLPDVYRYIYVHWVISNNIIYIYLGKNDLKRYYYLYL